MKKILVIVYLIFAGCFFITNAEQKLYWSEPHFGIYEYQNPNNLPSELDLATDSKRYDTIKTAYIASFNKFAKNNMPVHKVYDVFDKAFDEALKKGIAFDKLDAYRNSALKAEFGSSDYAQLNCNVWIKGTKFPLVYIVKITLVRPEQSGLYNAPISEEIGYSSIEHIDKELINVLNNMLERSQNYIKYELGLITFEEYLAAIRTNIK